MRNVEFYVQLEIASSCRMVKVHRAFPAFLFRSIREKNRRGTGVNISLNVSAKCLIDCSDGNERLYMLNVNNWNCVSGFVSDLMSGKIMEIRLVAEVN